MVQEQNAMEEFSSERYEGRDNSYNTILLRLDPTPTIEEIKRYLLRLTEYNSSTETWGRAKGIEPIFNEEGVQDLLLELRARMSVDKVLSCNTGNEIKLLTREIGEVVLEFIWFNSEKYNIQEEDKSRVFYMIKHNIELFLRRTLNGKENELLAKGLTHRETVNKSSSGRVDEEAQKTVGSFFGGSRGRYF